jgi:hypothetical protein
VRPPPAEGAAEISRSPFRRFLIAKGITYRASYQMRVAYMAKRASILLPSDDLFQ